MPPQVGAGDGWLEPRRSTEQARREAASPRAQLLPGLDVLRGYLPGWARWDGLAGVTVAAYLVPQCMAYAELAGLPAVAGLWAVLLPLVLYALATSASSTRFAPARRAARRAQGSDGRRLHVIALLHAGALGNRQILEKREVHSKSSAAWSRFFDRDG